MVPSRTSAGLAAVVALTSFSRTSADEVGLGQVLTLRHTRRSLVRAPPGGPPASANDDD